jgi:predicted nucleotidyltransferase
MNYSDPIGSIFDGAKGRILRALINVDGDLTLGALGQVADVSINRVSQIVNELVALGIVSRRSVPPSALVALERDNIVAKMLVQLANVDQVAITELKQLARRLAPQPVSGVVYGSFARGLADSESDIDVALFAPSKVFESESWVASLSAFVDVGSRALGNSISVVQISTQDIQKRRVTRSFLNEIIDNHVLIVGEELADLVN